MSYEDQGTGYDPGADGYERQGRASVGRNSGEALGADMVSRAAEAAVPDFWPYFYARHPKFALGRDDLTSGPIGYLHAFMVYEAMAETVTAYVKSGGRE